MRTFSNDLGMRAINTAKFFSGQKLESKRVVQQPHAQFAFLLDYVPNWKHIYKPGALIQFQSFVPFDAAPAIFRRQIELSQKAGIVPYLGVFKRHRPDRFLMSHAVDGFSFALDFPYNDRNRDGLKVLTDRLAAEVVAAGGRFYFAKDTLLSPECARAYLGQETIQRFTDYKRACDRENLLQTDLSRRLFGGFG